MTATKRTAARATLTAALAAALMILAGLPAAAQGAKEDGTAMSAGSLPAPESGRIEFTTLADAQELAAERPTVLFFFASWCPTCRAAIADIEARPDDLRDLALVIVNYDAERELRRRYGVSYQHTFVQIDADGAPVVVWNGGKVDEILENVVR